MEKFVNINIDKKDCKGISLFCDTVKKEISTSKEADRLIGNTFKLQLRTKIDGKTGKKIFTFKKSQKTFLKALEYVATQRELIREKIKNDGTVRKVKTVESDDSITFLEKVEEFLKNKRVSARDSTIQNYSTTLMLHAKTLHNKLFKDITIKDIQKIVNTMLENRAEATVVLMARTLRTFLRELKLDWDSLELPEVDNEVKYALSLKDTQKIIKVMREYSKIEVGDEIFYQYEEIKNIFAFSLTGRRIGEILALRFSDIDLEGNTFTIRKSTAKGKKELVYNLDNYLVEAIKSQMRLRKKEYENNSDTKIFSYTRETPRVHFQNIMKVLNLPKLRLHDIRHMLATTLVQNGVPIQDISVMLGHSSIAITESRYANKNKEQATRAINAFNNLME